ncbi:hypothetical protein [Pedobacter insulae]|uniref:Outer membrane scaffolding protein for murein synthesis, MipA/OmpV family n=1 Tax=Pedobacter insulae TaxID=414048 RepID=A0A1I3A0A1_9SPHI|nr:hypothetical protein [Pedobacter insulae]SFH43484.1 hypothetical protein SAMN04489864_11267 [Pedobacter insulae]
MKLIFLISMFCLLSMLAMAQQDSSKKTTITLATLYNSDVSYYGQATKEKLPYVLVNATLRFPVGLRLSAGSYKLLNYGSGISETDIGVGFDHDFNEKLNIDVSYIRSFFPANSPLLQASNENNLNISSSYSWPWLKTSLDLDYAFGTQNDIFLSLNNSKEINLGSVFNEKNIIYMEPAIELIAGTRYFYETYTVAKAKRNPGKGKGNSGNEATSVTSESQEFDLLSYNFKLPLSFSRANYIAEISYQLSVLGVKAGEELKKQQSFFGLAFYYQF